MPVRIPAAARLIAGHIPHAPRRNHRRAHRTWDGSSNPDAYLATGGRVPESALTHKERAVMPGLPALGRNDQNRDACDYLVKTPAARCAAVMRTCYRVPTSPGASRTSATCVRFESPLRAVCITAPHHLCFK